MTSASSTPPIILWLHERRAVDADLVGHKAARLAVLFRAGLPVPAGFVVTTHAFRLGLTAGVAVAVQSAYRELIGRGRPTGGGTGQADPPFPPVAVRSSAIAEDLVTASFAGVQATVLNVGSPPALLDAVRQVWDSHAAPAAQAYRERVGARDTLTAVLVQRQVHAKAAGVAFARDPVTGADCLLVEAVAGSGADLLAGRADPHFWRLEGERVLAAPAEPLLSPAQLERVGRLVAAAGAQLGAPQDVEWAADEHQIWLLQARPITTGGTDWFTERLPEDQHLWTAAFFNERFTRPVSPLGWTLVAAHLERLAVREPLALLSAPLDGPLLKLWHGHPYSRVAAWQRIYKLFPQALLPEDAGRYFPDGDTALRRAPARPVYGPKLFWHGLRVLSQNFGASSPLHNPRAWVRFEHRLADALQRLGTASHQLAQTPDPIATGRALLATAAQLTAELLELHRWSLLYAEVSYSSLQRLLRARHGARDGLARCARLTADVETITVRLNRDLAALAARISHDEPLRAALAHAETPTAVPDAEYAASLRRFLARYGHRSFSLDFCDPPWATDFAGFVRLLLALAQRGATPAIAARSAERPALWLRPLVRLAREYLRLREAQRYAWQQILALQREVVLQMGEWWAARGELALAEDVFGLTWNELQAGQPDAGRAAARMARLRQLRAEAARSPSWHYPDFLRGSTPLRAAPAGAELQGRPVSPGVARGPARLVAQPEDFERLCPGDILVTAAPDPAWTAIFGSVAGIVTERGGHLSHGGVVAREYGLPAVFGLTGVLQLLGDGEPLLVDGTQGVVFRLREPANGPPRHAES